MWRKSFALSLFLSLPLCFLSAQDTASDDSAILENQQAILSILPALTESLDSREADLSKREENSKSEQQALQKEKDDLQKREISISERENELSKTESQLQKLKNDVVTQSESLKRERGLGKWKDKGLVTMGVILIFSIIYGISK